MHTKKTAFEKLLLHIESNLAQNGNYHLLMDSITIDTHVPTKHLKILKAHLSFSQKLFSLFLALLQMRDSLVHDKFKLSILQISIKTIISLQKNHIQIIWKCRQRACFNGASNINSRPPLKFISNYRGSNFSGYRPTTAKKIHIVFDKIKDKPRNWLESQSLLLNFLKVSRFL